MTDNKGSSVAGRHGFANRLYKAVAEEHRKESPSKNLIMSPFSLEVVLSAAGFGARGETQRTIASAIGVPIELEPMKKRYEPILVGMQNESFTLKVATHIFAQDDYSLRQNFVNSSLEVFTCGVARVNYVTQPAEALSTINGWVEEKTEGLIKDLLTIDAITADTRLVLANAVYFKGKWTHPFDKDRTQKDKFTISSGEKVDVDMMFVEKRFRYGRVEDIKAEVIELPYEGGKLSMVILLPYEDSSIMELENKVSSANFDLGELLTSHTHNQEVMVYLPKFKLELTTNLEEVLAKLGMGLMFTDNADFSGMTDDPQGLKVSKVVQKAFIEVSEEGTTAAAATGLGKMLIMMPRLFHANRPFMFYLWQETSETILFCGQVTSP